MTTNQGHPTNHLFKIYHSEISENQTCELTVKQLKLCCNTTDCQIASVQLPDECTHQREHKEPEAHQS